MESLADAEREISLPFPYHQSSPPPLAHSAPFQVRFDSAEQQEPIGFSAESFSARGAALAHQGSTDC